MEMDSALQPLQRFLEQGSEFRQAFDAALEYAIDQKEKNLQLRLAEVELRLAILADGEKRAEWLENWCV